jgi:hypothetical protein|tara:strand:- start:824 stop:1096 length:273 start_codon:yes stop_codon:yes gene_type:complete
LLGLSAHFANCLPDLLSPAIAPKIDRAVKPVFDVPDLIVFIVLNILFAGFRIPQLLQVLFAYLYSELLLIKILKYFNISIKKNTPKYSEV